MIARAPRSFTLRVSTSDGQSVEFTVSPGDNIEALDPLAALALDAQIRIGALEAVGARPARIDHDIDSKPRRPRPNGAAVGREDSR